MSERDAWDARLSKLAASAHDRASRKMADIAACRERSIADDAAHPGRGWKDRKWPAHATDGTPIPAGAPLPLAGLSRMAAARAGAGMRLTADDLASLDAYPDGSPYDVEWAAACERYRDAVWADMIANASGDRS